LGAFLTTLSGDDLAAFFAAFFGTDGTLDFLPPEERMILAMIRIY
jgi:hypothetical protein